MILTLPYPDKLLWPNGRTRNYYAKAAKVKSHRQMAWGAALASRADFVPAETIGLHIVVHGKPSGPLPDRDNVIASVKAYQDGIAQALGIDDKHFTAPTVEFAKERKSQFVIHVGGKK